MKARTAHVAKPQRKRFMARTLGAAAAAGALVWLALAGSVPTESGTKTQAIAPVAVEGPGYAIEDFNYPGADKILAEKNIVLKRGDGHITLVDCSSGPGLLEVWAREQAGAKFCFEVVGNSGWLTLEIPSVALIKGNDYTTEVDMTVGAEEKTFDIAKNAWTSVGESAEEQGRQHMLVEIRSTK
ncbi:hypothetical protein ACF068_12435 [Streptomyces sp. NPDC016309]|uniref:hypothetical protein n=1 Tax=Streptomyces sp. NPDC016309 TaxID=3364965 RepID=UPI0036F9C49C